MGGREGRLSVSGGGGKQSAKQGTIKHRLVDKSSDRGHAVHSTLHTLHNARNRSKCFYGPRRQGHLSSFEMMMAHRASGQPSPPSPCHCLNFIHFASHHTTQPTTHRPFLYSSTFALPGHGPRSGLDQVVCQKSCSNLTCPCGVALWARPACF